MNIVKTKIGFYTKPYAIQAANVCSFINFPPKVCAHFFLLMGIIASGINWMYYQPMIQRNRVQLSSLQREHVALNARYRKALVEYHQLTSKERLHALNIQLNMKKPTQEEIIYIPTDSV